MPVGQSARVRRDRRIAPDQLAALNARLKRLPDILANRQAREIEERREQQRRQKRQLIEDRIKQEEREARAAVGIQAAQTGGRFILGEGGLGSTSFGDIGGKIKSAFGGGATPTAVSPGGTMAGASTRPSGAGSPFGMVKSAIGKQTLGSTVGPGLIGFGASSLLGGANPLKKVLLGAGAGLISNLFTGAGGGGLSGFASGGLFGGLGGLAGGIL